MRVVTCGNCFVGSVDPQHTREDHQYKGPPATVAIESSMRCTREGCDCLGWTPTYPLISMTAEQAERLRILSDRAEEVTLEPGWFDLPDGYVVAKVRRGAHGGAWVTYGIAPDGRASS